MLAHLPQCTHRGTTLLVGATGFCLTHAWSLWDRFADPTFWWMHAMVLVWVVFTAMLFVAEPLVLHRWFPARAQREPESTFRIIERLHWALLTVSLVTVVGATVGKYGG